MLTALTVGSLPAVALAAVAPWPKDAHALVHAGVGLAQVHGASCFCNRHKQSSRLSTSALLQAKTQIHQERCKKMSSGANGTGEIFKHGRGYKP